VPFLVFLGIYYWNNYSKKDELDRTCGAHGRTYRVLIGGKMQLGRLKPRWENNIKTDLNETGSES
jgi:hypothetical protein